MMMKKVLALPALVLMMVSCHKESDDILWSRSYGTGNAYCVMVTPDAGILACGVMNSKPYLLRLSPDKNILSDYASDRNGLFTSVWGDTSCFIAAGSSDGNMLLSRISKEGNKVWDTTLTAGFTIERTSFIHTGNGNFLAVGSLNPDSSGYMTTGLLFVRFDTAGQIIIKKEIAEISFISAGDVTADNAGNIYLPLTRRNIGAKSIAAVAKYNGDIQKLWETELYNNPDVASNCIGIETDAQDSLYVTGKTEVERTEGTLDNSYIASLGSSGSIGKKEYLENSNSGCDLVLDDNDQIMMLNKNCFFISIIDRLSGYTAERLRLFSSCDEYNTDAFGTDLDIDLNGNIVVAGSLGDNFYLALKSPQQ